MFLTVLSVLVALFTATNAGAQNLTFPHDGLDRQYRIHIPDQVADTAALVLALHGYSGNNRDMMNNYGWMELADERGFVVAFPNGTQDQWNNRFWDVDYDFHQGLDIDDDGFLASLAVHLQQLHGLDPDRTFVTGFSNGAEMCFQLACRESETFVAFAPIIGMMMDTLFTNCDPAVARPILSVNGTEDDVTLFEGDMNNTGGWGAYRSIPETMAFWANILGTTSFERTYLPDTDPNDGSTVRLDVYSSLQHDRELWYYLVFGGDHDWPGKWGNMDIDATLEVWNFFDSLSEEPPPRVDQIALIRASRFTMKDDAVSPIDLRKRRLSFRSAAYRGSASGVVAPAFGTDGDPTSAGASGGGATLTIHQAGGNPEDAVELDLAASRWQRRGSATKPGYSYKDSNSIDGPISKVSLRNGTLTISGKGAGLYTLEDAPQGELALRLRLGTGDAFCTAAEAKDPPSKNDSTARFIGVKNSPLPNACPPLNSEEP